MGRNEIVLTGEVMASDGLRSTPAGVPVTTFTMRHVSAQAGAGTQRQVEFDMDVVTAGDTAIEAGKLRQGQRVRVKGFLANRRRSRHDIILHATRVALE